MSNVDPITSASITSTDNTSKTTVNNFKNKAASHFNKNTSSLKEDTLSLSNKVSKNKKGLIIGAAAALGIAAGIIYGVKTGKLQGLIENIKGNKVQNIGEEIIEDSTSILEEGNKIQKEVEKAGKEILEESREVFEEGNKIQQAGKEVYKEAQRTLDEVCNYAAEGNKNGFKEVKDEGGNVIRRFVKIKSGYPYGSDTMMMKELNDAGNITRETIFDAYERSFVEIKNIKEYIDATGKRYNEISVDSDCLRKTITDVSKGVETDVSKDVAKLVGRRKKIVAESFAFDKKGDVCGYEKGCEELTNGLKDEGGKHKTKKVAESLELSMGKEKRISKIDGYEETYKKDIFGNRDMVSDTKCIKIFDFNDKDELIKYSKDNNIRKKII